MRPVHHLFKMFARRSRSSTRRVRFDGWLAYALRKGSSEERTTFALKVSDLEENFEKSPSNVRKMFQSSSFFLGSVKPAGLWDVGGRGEGGCKFGESGAEL